jgi:hypothetical protein
MLELEEQCSCEPRDWNGAYWKHEPCPACEAWGNEHSIVMDELQLAPHEDIQDPDAKSPYPEGCFADKHFYSSRDPAAMERWRALEQAVKAQK